MNNNPESSIIKGREQFDATVSNPVEATVMAHQEPQETSSAELPSAFNHLPTIFGKNNQRLAVFLDYDGTLSPIVPRPEDAVLDEELRGIIRRLARQCVVAIVSGRGLADVRERVGLEEIVYAGSHGFEIAGPDGLEEENLEAQAARPALDDAEARIMEKLKAVPGAQLERKKYSVAVHFRNVDEARIQEVDAIVNEMAQRHASLRRSGGKKVFELQPNVDWHKGRAVDWLLKTLGLDQADVLPLYLGDDLTDEDAFRALRRSGIGIIVRDEPRATAARCALESPA
ncbi:MAG TPA: trehalose-phosphatase, partial [Candidatus Binatia bacterium]|nr:trehalose-phosphatase [Candidatus Binatia bacterium]